MMKYLEVQQGHSVQGVLLIPPTQGAQLLLQAQEVQVLQVLLVFQGKAQLLDHPNKKKND